MYVCVCVCVCLCLCLCSVTKPSSLSAAAVPGVQRQIVHCVEKTTGIVQEHLCDPLTRPDDNQTSCNKDPCPAVWVYLQDIVYQMTPEAFIHTHTHTHTHTNKHTRRGKDRESVHCKKDSELQNPKQHKCWTIRVDDFVQLFFIVAK